MVYSSHIMPMMPIFVRFSGGYHSSLCTNQIQSQEGKATELETRSVKSCKMWGLFSSGSTWKHTLSFGKVQQQLKSVVFFLNVISYGGFLSHKDHGTKQSRVFLSSRLSTSSLSRWRSGVTERVDVVDTSNVPRRAMKGSHLPFFHPLSIWFGPHFQNCREWGQSRFARASSRRFSVPAACDSAGPWKPLSRSACQGWSGPFVMLIMDIVALVLHNRVYATPSATLKLHWSQRICIILHLHSTCGLPNFLNVSNAMSSTTSTLFFGLPLWFRGSCPPQKKSDRIPPSWLKLIAV